MCQAAWTTGRLGSTQRRLQQGQSAGRQPLAHDAQFGLGLDGDVELYGPFGAVGRAADTEAAPPLGVGAGPFGDAARGSGKASSSGAPPPSRASASYARSAVVLPLPLRPARRVSGPEREEGAPVPGEGGEPQLGDARPFRTRSGVRAGQHRRQG